MREVRNGGRYLVEIGGRSIVTTIDQLTPQEAARKSARTKRSEVSATVSRRMEETSSSLDLHGNTVDEALDLVSRFLNAAFLDGNSEVQIIHGRSGGKLKSALHAELKRMPSIRGYAIDPRNPGVTIVKLS